MILVDSNVIMYAAGGKHRNRAKSLRFLEKVARGEVAGVIDAEVLQELLHRYRSIDKWTDGRRVFDLTRKIFPAVVPVDSEVVDKARRLMDEHRHLYARDAVHAAVVLIHDLDGICSFDRDFDRLSQLKRFEPE